MAERTELMPVHIMGKRYDVPPSLTIMKAMEWHSPKPFRQDLLPRVGASQTAHELQHGIGCQSSEIQLGENT